MPIQTNAKIREIPGLRTIVPGHPHVDRRNTVNGVDLKTIQEVLVAAVAEIESPARWCKNSPAVLRDGAVVRDLDDLTIYPQDWIDKKCAEGAIHYAAFWLGHPTKVALAAVQLLERRIRGDLYDKNDSPETTHADIMAIFRSAIADLARGVA